MNDEIIQINPLELEIVTQKPEVVEYIEKSSPQMELWMVAPGPPGPPGPQGPKGDSGAGVPIYTHTQIVPATEWLVAHGLNKYPSVTIVDSANTVVYGDIEYLGISSLVVRFSVPFSGQVHCN